MAKTIYIVAICILVPLLLVMFILAFDAFSYGEMVHKSYIFHRNCDMIGRMAEVIERDSSLAAYRIMTVWTKDGSLKPNKQFKKLSANEYNDGIECYLFDYASDNIFGMNYSSSHETSNCNKIELFSVSSISGNKLCLQSKDSIPITTFVRPQLCGLLSSYGSSRRNSSLFESCLIKKMGLDYREKYEMTAESGSILRRLFPHVEPGSEQWFQCRNTIYIVFGCNIILLILFIVLRVRTKRDVEYGKVKRL